MSMNTATTDSPEAAPSQAVTHDSTRDVPAIRVRNLMVSYQGRPVLRSASFDVPRGTLVGIVGPNGAGKSTLLKAMLGLARPDSGTVEFFGQPFSSQRQRVAYVPQTGAVDWDFPVTVGDAVLMGRYGRLGLFGRPGAKDRAAADEAMETVGMTAYRDRHIRRLSGGQQQRVFLARALCQQADVLFLDEPFAGVDAATERAIFDLITKLSRSGRTLLLVNHDLSVLDRFDTVMLINGRLVAMGPTRDVVTEQNMRLTYGGKLSLIDRAEAALRGEK
jgi:manganese/zinc/iron transport system ATP- binding protein